MLEKLHYIEINQVIALNLIVMAMELHVKNSSKKEASSKLLFLLSETIATNYPPSPFYKTHFIILKNDT